MLRGNIISALIGLLYGSSDKSFLRQFLLIAEFLQVPPHSIPQGHAGPFCIQSGLVFDSFVDYIIVW